MLWVGCAPQRVIPLAISFPCPFHHYLQAHRIHRKQKAISILFSQFVNKHVMLCDHLWYQNLSSRHLRVQPPASDRIGEKLTFPHCGTARYGEVESRNCFLQYEKEKEKTEWEQEHGHNQPWQFDKQLYASCCRQPILKLNIALDINSNYWEIRII